MEVLGRDSAREAYRVATSPPDRLVGLIPEAVIAEGMSLTGGRGHQTAYDWIARHARDIEKTLKALRNGQRAAPPFDRMELVEE
ncbi:hypothetical protein [Roseisalinus antarcticus]|uniref:Uncharacterized protein n=1 Tax=Roseisalinus antarcticus TaxID=254357 RepID=A0A1Y5T2I4_9RHOB|nr:hypothetical protein [Roseisalinus antarcticus]SLN54420.1 hypothetical protein ROA7023_02432 [Roseisalinus antarcticus]